jgi:hypothetical protein
MKLIAVGEGLKKIDTITDKNCWCSIRKWNGARSKEYGILYRITISIRMPK